MPPNRKADKSSSAAASRVDAKSKRRKGAVKAIPEFVTCPITHDIMAYQVPCDG